jgi:hypothetical protein
MLYNTLLFECVIVQIDDSGISSMRFNLPFYFVPVEHQTGVTCKEDGFFVTANEYPSSGEVIWHLYPEAGIPA